MVAISEQSSIAEAQENYCNNFINITEVFKKKLRNRQTKKMDEISKPPKECQESKEKTNR